MRRHFRSWCRRCGGRALLVAIGVGLCTLGAVNAYRSEATTSLVIAGAVLTALGLLRLREVTITAGGVTAGAIIEATEHLDEIREREDVPEDVKEKIVDTVAGLNEAAKAEELGRDAAPRATHRRIGQDRVALELLADGPATSILLQYRCVVTDPSGLAASAAATRPRGWFGPVRAVYPDDFPGAETLTPGRYRVDWEAESRLDFSTLLGGRLIARDVFVVRRNDAERRQANGQHEGNEAP